MPLRSVPVILLLLIASACVKRTSTIITTTTDGTSLITPTLVQEINNIITEAPGIVGVAFVTDGDTLTFNNGMRFPMMSVIKLHQSLAALHHLDSLHIDPDTLITINPAEIDRDTWSPMLDTYGTNNRPFAIETSRLINFALTMSDNNASNLLFNRLVGPAETDRYIRSIAPDTAFAIIHTEAAMKRDHDLSYDNYTSPLSAALLIGETFGNDTLLSAPSMQIVRDALTSVTTGSDRISAALTPYADRIAVFAHKTGSGYRNSRGELMAHNDVAYIRLTDGRDVALAILIRDFRGTESEASAIISTITATLLSNLLK